MKYFILSLLFICACNTPSNLEKPEEFTINVKDDYNNIIAIEYSDEHTKSLLNSIHFSENMKDHYKLYYNNKIIPLADFDKVYNEKSNLIIKEDTTKNIRYIFITTKK